MKFHDESCRKQQDAAQGENQQLRFALHEHGKDRPADAQKEAADDDGPVLQQHTRHALGQAHDDDDDERHVHGHQEDGNGTERDGEGTEHRPHCAEHLAHLVLRDGGLVFAHQRGHRVADKRHREPQEVPLRLAGEMPQEIDCE